MKKWQKVVLFYIAAIPVLWAVILFTHHLGLDKQQQFAAFAALCLTVGGIRRRVLA
jgi:hypothetical protein